MATLTQIMTTNVNDRQRMVALQRQRSEPILRIEGRDYDITNLFPISETRTMVGLRGNSCRELAMERSLYPAKEDLLKSIVEVDAFRSSSSSTSLDLRLRRSRRLQSAKVEGSLYPRISRWDSSLDPEDTEVIFRKYPRRKSVTYASSQSTETLNLSFPMSSFSQSDFELNDAKLPPRSSSKRPKTILGTDQDGNPEATVEFITRLRQPPASYSLNSHRGSGDQHDGTNKMDLSSLQGTARRQSKSRSFADIDDNWTREETMTTATERNREYDRNESILLLRTTTTKSTPSSSSRMVEVAPGIVMELRGAAETLHAIELGVAASVTCACCQVPLLCVPDAECVICPDCKVVSPVYIACATNQIRGGVGLGLKDFPAQD